MITFTSQAVGLSREDQHAAVVRQLAPMAEQLGTAKPRIPAAGCNARYLLSALPCLLPLLPLLSPGLSRSPLTQLSLCSNHLSGTLPPVLALLPVLALDLSGNSLGGQLPAGLGANSMLRELRLRNNSLSGSLPEGFVG